MSKAPWDNVPDRQLPTLHESLDRIFADAFAQRGLTPDREAIDRRVTEVVPIIRQILEGLDEEHRAEVMREFILLRHGMDKADRRLAVSATAVVPDYDADDPITYARLCAEISKRYQMSPAEIARLPIGDLIGLVEATAKRTVVAADDTNAELPPLTIADRAIQAIHDAHPNWINASEIGRHIGEKPASVRAALSNQYPGGRHAPYESDTSGRTLGYRWKT